MKPSNPVPRSLAILSALLFAASNCAARGGPAAPAEPARLANANAAPALKSATNQPASVADDDKDINPFTGQSLSEAQLRRTLEREKLVTAIASEKTKQTQSNSELHMARLRNAAEKSRLATETKILVPLPVSPGSPVSSPTKARASTLAHASGKSEHQTPNTAWPAPTGSGAAPAAAAVALSPTRSEIRFADELVELKPGPARNPSVVASVDAQRSADQNQSRAITPISVAPAGLAPQALSSTAPNVSSFVPAPLQR